MAEQPYQPYASVPPDEAGSGGRILPAGWAEKTEEILVKKPIYRRQRFRRFVLAALLMLIAAGTIGGLTFLRWHHEQMADLARQRHDVEAFVRSASFEAFAREADAQFVAALNYAMLRPATIGGLLPEIAAAEKSHHQMPWALELSPLPVSTATQPARVHLAVHQATDLLAQRGFAFDAVRIADARHVFLRLLTPHARTFLAENTRADFPALTLDRRLQDIVLGAYAARAGGTREETEHAFVFYSIVGPVLWRELDAQPRRVEPGK